MAEFETGGHTYRTTKMNAREQLHLLRGLGPLFGPMVQLSLVEPDNASDAARQLAFMIPFFDTFARMERKEVDELVNKCFAATRRREGGNGSSVWGPPLFGSRDQYEDIDLTSLMTICWEVVQENLGSFFAIGRAPPVNDIATQMAPALTG
jgi:hypothetical protein